MPTDLGTTDPSHMDHMEEPALTVHPARTSEEPVPLSGDDPLKRIYYDPDRDEPPEFKPEPIGAYTRADDAVRNYLTHDGKQRQVFICETSDGYAVVDRLDRSNVALVDRVADTTLMAKDLKARNARREELLAEADGIAFSYHHIAAQKQAPQCAPDRTMTEHKITRPSPVDPAPSERPIQDVLFAVPDAA